MPSNAPAARVPFALSRDTAHDPDATTVGRAERNGPQTADTSVATTAAPTAHRAIGPRLVWGGTGFLAGAIVWHAIGFWSFMADVVFHGPPATASRAAPGAQRMAAVDPGQPITTGSITTGSITPSAGTERGRPGKSVVTVDGDTRAPTGTATSEPCSALVLDRATGATRMAPCLTDELPMRTAGPAVRGDRLPDPRQPIAEGWAVRVDQHARSDN